MARVLFYNKDTGEWEYADSAFIVKPGESSGSDIVLDTTLTQSGQAADAKAVGDALAELEEKIPEETGGIFPTATADKLGGIKADPKTEADTQPVRIGEDGKLYTAPGTSGGGITPVSGGDLELIATVTTTEEVTVIEIDTDSNGEQFALKDIGIKLDRTYTNPGSTGLIIESTSVDGRSLRLAYIANMSKVTQYIRKFYSDSFVVSMFSSAADSSSEIKWEGFMCPSNVNISKIKLNLSKANISFPVGTKIELWGVRV